MSHRFPSDLTEDSEWLEDLVSLGGWAKVTFLLNQTAHCRLAARLLPPCPISPFDQTTLDWTRGDHLAFLLTTDGLRFPLPAPSPLILLLFILLAVSFIFLFYFFIFFGGCPFFLLFALSRASRHILWIGFVIVLGSFHWGVFLFGFETVLNIFNSVVVVVSVFKARYVTRMQFWREERDRERAKAERNCCISIFFKETVFNCFCFVNVRLWKVWNSKDPKTLDIAMEQNKCIFC